MPKFILELSLGNDGMRTGYDVAHAIRDIAFLMQDKGNFCEIGKISKKTIRDINGNTVGYYEVRE